MALDGCRTEEKLGGDGFVKETGGDGPRNLPLSRAEQLKRIRRRRGKRMG